MLKMRRFFLLLECKDSIFNFIRQLQGLRKRLRWMIHYQIIKFISLQINYNFSFLLLQLFLEINPKHLNLYLHKSQKFDSNIRRIALYLRLPNLFQTLFVFSTLIFKLFSLFALFILSFFTLDLFKQGKIFPFLNLEHIQNLQFFSTIENSLFKSRNIFRNSAYYSFCI